MYEIDTIQKSGLRYEIGICIQQAKSYGLTVPINVDYGWVYPMGHIVEQSDG